MERLGCHKPALEQCIYILKHMEHYIKTAYDISNTSNTGTANKPIQGIVQGYGPAPTGWGAISTPIINMMHSKGFGFKHWSAIKQRAFNLICFSFVDDTNVLNTLQPGNYDIIQLISNTQNALNY